MKLSRTLTLVCMVAFAVMVYALSVAAKVQPKAENNAEAAKAVKSIPNVQVSTIFAVDTVITNYNLSLSSGVQPEYLAFGLLANKEIPKTVNTIGRISPVHGPPIVNSVQENRTDRRMERYERPDPVPRC